MMIVNAAADYANAMTTKKKKREIERKTNAKWKPVNDLFSYDFLQLNIHLYLLQLQVENCRPACNGNPEEFGSRCRLTSVNAMYDMSTYESTFAIE